MFERRAAKSNKCESLVRGQIRNCGIGKVKDPTQCLESLHIRWTFYTNKTLYSTVWYETQRIGNLAKY